MQEIAGTADASPLAMVMWLAAGAVFGGVITWLVARRIAHADVARARSDAMNDADASGSCHRGGATGATGAT